MWPAGHSLRTPGLEHGQPPTERQAVGLRGICEVEVYPAELLLAQHSDMDTPHTAHSSHTDSTDLVLRTAQDQCVVSPQEETRRWVKNAEDSFERLCNTRCPQLWAGGRHGDPKQGWYLAQPAAPHCEQRAGGGGGIPGPARHLRSHPPGQHVLPELSLQRLSNGPAHRVLPQHRHLEERNFCHPLGMKGDGRGLRGPAGAGLARPLPLHRPMCSRPRPATVHPSSGLPAHDSQELLSFLLDGRHEDLNRVKKRNTWGSVMLLGGLIKKLLWRPGRTTNGGTILGLLFKSPLVCPDCDNVSVTFDPFCYLSVPLPVSHKRVMEVFFVSMDPRRKPEQHWLVVPRKGKISDLCMVLAKHTGVSPERMMVADVSSHRFYKISQLEESEHHLGSGRYIHLRGRSVAENTREDVVIPIYLRERTPARDHNNSYYGLVLWCPCPGTSPGTPCTTFCCTASHAIQRGYGSRAPADSSPGPSHWPQRTRRKHLFTLQMVNSNGTSDRSNFNEDTQAQPYIAIDWDPEMKKRYYDEGEAEGYHKHDCEGYVLKAAPVRLQERTELFTTVETLEENPWYCPTASSTSWPPRSWPYAHYTPEALLLHQVLREKLDTLAEFPIRDLDFSEFVIKLQDESAPELYKYDLIAVSDHYGGLRDGHYTTFACNKDSGQWHYFDTTASRL
ncbi:LOW QUALITY PROTEIN: hypothetical protein QTO34_012541 [Cnephaeus nilssonii]|uniref:ubiquitinyl hydrolase 1 n=1 Tax=Cnephaeus nilssonii TaxID=3371016 RepID=A0AA40HBP2_CNENI|nr:LOW QUALITY PROTEIN: hypothetical protein QTO34_012541 [Eptesicus nilssonii]